MAGKSARANNRGSNLFSNFMSGKVRDFRTTANAFRSKRSSIDATGGTKIVGQSHNYHVFLNGTTDNFVINSNPLNENIEVLIVAGGGGGGWSYYAGGGGGGGVVHTSALPAPAGTYPIAVGAGGASPPPTGIHGANGGDSSFNSVVALGGGGGFAGSAAYPGSASGGSGGGGHGYPADASDSIVAAPQPVPGSFTAYGHPGKAGVAYAGGGGGGAGAVGTTAGSRPATGQPGVVTPTPGTSYFGGLGGAGKDFPGFPASEIAPAIPTTAITDAPAAAGGPGSVTQRAAFTAVVSNSGLYAGGGGGGLYYTYGPDPTAAGKPAGGTGGGADGAGEEYDASLPGPAPVGVIPTKGPARKAVNHTGGGGGGGNYATNSAGSVGAPGIVLVKY